MHVHPAAAAVSTNPCALSSPCCCITVGIKGEGGPPLFARSREAYPTESRVVTARGLDRRVYGLYVPIGEGALETCELHVQFYFVFFSCASLRERGQNNIHRQQRVPIVCQKTSSWLKKKPIEHV